MEFDVADPVSVELLNMDIHLWNHSRELNPDVVPDLTRARLARKDLYAANLTGVDHRGASLLYSSLSQLESAILQSARGSEAQPEAGGDLGKSVAGVVRE